MRHVCRPIRLACDVRGPYSALACGEGVQHVLAGCLLQCNGGGRSGQQRASVKLEKVLVLVLHGIGRAAKQHSRHLHSSSMVAEASGLHGGSGVRWGGG